MVDESNPRADLRAAHLQRERVRDHLTRIQSAIGRSEKLLAQIEQEIADHDAAERRRREEVTDRLLQAIKTGEAEDFARDDRAADRDEVARAANGARLVSAQRVIAQLKTEETEVGKTLDVIEATIALSVRRIMHADARAQAAKWAEADRLAAALRMRLGRTFGVVHKLGGIEGDLQAAISENNAAPFDLAEHTAVEGVWANLAAALALGQTDARPDFLPIDELREAAAVEREERAASTARLLESMRALEQRTVQ
jgi:hypothetical protein